MAVNQKVITDNYALYNGDCIEVMADMPSESVHLSVYSPPFGGLYQYSSSERDLSNNDSYEEFLKHYEFVVSEIARLTKPGRMTVVHCMDVPTGNTGIDAYIDFAGDIIRMHSKHGFTFSGRHGIRKEPLAVRNRTYQKNLFHKTLNEDSINCGLAAMDQLLLFRKKGKNEVPAEHPTGMMSYAGEREIPKELLPYRGFSGKQTENRFSHWIWRQYADSFWDDIRVDRVLPFKAAREQDDEKHVHPLQLDVIERIVQLRSNPGEVVFTPFMGVGSEVYMPVLLGRKGVGAELKESYYRQAVKNVEAAYTAHGEVKGHDESEQTEMIFDEVDHEVD